MHDWLKNIRKTCKMTQQQVSILSGITRASYTNIENGVRTPSTKTAKKIAKVLNFDWQLFYPDDNDADSVKEAI